MISSNSHRRAVLTGLFLAGSLFLSSCFEDDSARASGSQPGNGGTNARLTVVVLPEITPARGFPAKIKNFDGRTAVLKGPPQQVIAGNASLLDGLILLIGPERMAALPSTSMTYSSLTEDLGDWSQVSVLKHFDAEELLEPEPDLILVHAYQAGSTIDRVIERDVPVVVLPVSASWKQTLAELECLARIVDEEQRCADAIAKLEERRRALQVKSPRSGLRVLPYGNYGSGGTTAGAGTTWQMMIELAGMRNAASEAGLDGHPDIDFEQLLSIDPDFFLVAKSEGQSGSGAEAILNGEPLLADLRAVRERRFLVLPEFLYSCASHQLLTAAEQIAVQADAQLATK